MIEQRSKGVEGLCRGVVKVWSMESRLGKEGTRNMRGILGSEYIVGSVR